MNTNKILVVAEHHAGVINLSTHKTITCALQIPNVEVDIIVFSADDKSATHAAKLTGIKRVISVLHSQFAEPVAATLAPGIAEIAADYTHVFAPSTTFGKDVLPRVAALLGVGQLSDIMAVNGSHSFVRPIYAGNALVHVNADESQKLLATVRIASFEPVSETGNASVENRNITAALPHHTRFVSRSEDN